MLRDFGDAVRDACEQGTTKKLLERWNADPNIRLEWSSAPVIVSQGAFHKDARDNESLEDVADLADHKNREIPFTCIFDEPSLRVTRMLRGEVGSFGLCDWEAGTLLSQSRAALRQQKYRISLGHTHPKGYGAICSDVYWDEEDLSKFKDPASAWTLRRGLYRTWGGDYTEMYARRMLEPRSISRFAWILSPRENQAGVFEILHRGRVRYHPWYVEKRET